MRYGCAWSSEDLVFVIEYLPRSDERLVERVWLPACVVVIALGKNMSIWAVRMYEAIRAGRSLKQRFISNGSGPQLYGALGREPPTLLPLRGATKLYTLAVNGNRLTVAILKDLIEMVKDPRSFQFGLGGHRKQRGHLYCPAAIAGCSPAGLWIEK
ncbi:Leucine-rich repeat-containing protein 75B [Triplophysa tibetana]|uniref:Leucine-rich repeat-containing protein 75B n=1 Tax=Triplophysa tibetana TaxID=1572043 RepID=A0A5A9N5Y6_9TELE|nr:Leucine-rich repeat-containing protein 75B [Triplophysa tibetana]